MKYRITRIKEYPLREVAKKLGISVRQVSIIAKVKNTYVNEACLGRSCLSEKSALKVMEAVEKIKNNARLRNRLIKNGRHQKIDKSMHKELKDMRKSGATLQKIATKFGVTRERIRQICKKYKFYKK